MAQGYGPKREKDHTWYEEHGAQFRLDEDGLKIFKSPGDSEQYFKATHGQCVRCDGTGFELFEKLNHHDQRPIDASLKRYERYSRRCSLLPPLVGRRSSGRSGGFEQAATPDQW